MPLKVFVDTGESVWSTNGLEFETYEKATEYGEAVMWRWLAVREYAVIPVPSNFIGQLSTEAIRKVQVRE